MHFHRWADLSALGRGKFIEGSLVGAEQEEVRSESEGQTSTGFCSPPSASTRSRGTLPACRVGTNSAGPLKEVTVPMTVRINVPKGHHRPPRSSPFLKRLLRRSSILDDAAKKEWADDVECRLQKVVETLELSGASYDVERSGNGVRICTVSPKELAKHQIAMLSAGRWPGWSEILKAVPEFTSSMVEFDASQRLEWCRRWDIDDEESDREVQGGILYRSRF